MPPATVLPISIVIPTLNEERFLPFLLGSLMKAKGNFEVIVVDGYSKDATEEVALAHAVKAREKFALRLYSIT